MDKLNKKHTEGKMTPQAVEVESNILGSILLNAKLFDVVQDNFTADMFYKEAHQIIAEAIILLKNMNKPIDMVTVISELKRKGRLEFVGGAYYVSTLTNSATYNASNLEYYIKIVTQEATKRQAIQIGSTIIQESYKETSDIFDIIDIAEKAVNDLTKKIITSKIVDSGHLAVETNKLNTIIQNSGGVSGITTGFSAMDKKIGGWQKTDLIILAARPGMGKTALATQLLMNPAMIRDTPTAIFSLEMSSTQLYMRMKSQLSGIDLYKFTKSGLNQVELDSCDSSCKRLYQSPIYFDDMGGVDLFQLRNKARKLKREKNIELLIIDYLQLISMKGHKGNREQEISQISMGLKSLAKELDIAIICLSQLSREVEKRGGAKIPVLSDLRESGSIEQDADMVLFIYRPEYYGIFEDGNGNNLVGKAQIIIAKNRNGGLDDIVLTWNGQQVKFSDINHFAEPIKPNENFENQPF